MENTAKHTGEYSLTPEISQIYRRQAADLESWFSSDERKIRDPMPSLSDLVKERLKGAIRNDVELSFMDSVAYLYSVPTEHQLAVYLYICGFLQEDINSLMGDGGAENAKELVNKYIEGLALKEKSSARPQVLADEALSRTVHYSGRERSTRPSGTVKHLKDDSEYHDIENDDDTNIGEDAPESRLIGKDVNVSTDSVRAYLNEIGKFDLLTAEQEVNLSKRIEVGLLAKERLEMASESDTQQISDLRKLVRQGEEAYELFYSSNLRLVVSVARRYVGLDLSFMDLIQEGNLGLVRAVQMFDYTKGFKFSTYATWWIRQAITRARANDGRMVRVPVHVHDLIVKVHRTREDLRTKSSNEPTTSEIAIELGVPEQKVIDALKHGRSIASLDQPMSDESDAITLGSTIADERSITGERITEEADTIGAFQRVLGMLSEREANVIRMRYGMNGSDPMTLDEIGKQLGVTRERVRQIEAKSLAKLRHPAYRLKQFIG